MQKNIKINNLYLVLIIAFSLCIRIFNLFIFEGYDSKFIEDSAGYFNIAIFAEENGILNWENHRRPPFISFIVIPIIKIFSEDLSIIIIKFLMIFLSVFTCIALYFLSYEITKNNKISFIVSLIYSIYPYSVFTSGRFLTENLASLLICFISIFLIKFINNPKFKFLIFASFLMGLLSLTRSSYYYLPFFLIFIIIFVNVSKFKKILSVILIFITFYLTISPWIIKNYIQLNAFVPTTTRLGTGLWLTNNDFTNKYIKMGGYAKTEKFHNESNKATLLGPIEGSNYLKEKALNEILNNKSEFIKVCFFRFLNFFNPKPNPYADFKVKDMIMILFFTPFLVIFFISLFRSKYNLEKFSLLIIIVYALLSSMPFYGIPRFRLPVDSLIFLLSIIFIFENNNYKIFLKKLF